MTIIQNHAKDIYPILTKKEARIVSKEYSVNDVCQILGVSQMTVRRAFDLVPEEVRTGLNRNNCEMRLITEAGFKKIKSMLIPRYPDDTSPNFLARELGTTAERLVAFIQELGLGDRIYSFGLPGKRISKCIIRHSDAETIREAWKNACAKDRDIPLHSIIFECYITPELVKYLGKRTPIIQILGVWYIQDESKVKSCINEYMETIGYVRLAVAAYVLGLSRQRVNAIAFENEDDESKIVRVSEKRSYMSLDFLEVLLFKKDFKPPEGYLPKTTVMRRLGLKTNDLDGIPFISFKFYKYYDPELVKTTIKARAEEEKQERDKMIESLNGDYDWLNQKEILAKLNTSYYTLQSAIEALGLDIDCYIKPRIPGGKHKIYNEKLVAIILGARKSGII